MPTHERLEIALERIEKRDGIDIDIAGEVDRMLPKRCP